MYKLPYNIISLQRKKREKARKQRNNARKRERKNSIGCRGFQLLQWDQTAREPSGSRGVEDWMEEEEGAKRGEAKEYIKLEVIPQR